MKKFILFGFFSIIMLFSQSNAQAYMSVNTNVTSRTSNSGLKNCNNTTFSDEGAGAGTAYGIPDVTTNSAPSSGVNRLCKTHKYYYSSLDSSTYYDKAIITNGLGTNCNSGDRAIAHPTDSSKIRCLKHDDIAPSLSDITNSNSGSKKQATNLFNYSISIADGGQSPINKLVYQYENTGAETMSGNYTKTSSPWSFSWDISKVQDGFRQSDGSRGYTFRINKICDSAKNCFTGPKDYTTYVYANKTSITSSSTETISSSSNVADGTAKKISLKLIDNYGNSIVKATGIGRKINFKFNNVDNTMFLNQYTKAGNSIFSTKANDSSYANNFLNGMSLSKTFFDELSTNGNYDYSFSVYTPTANMYPQSDPNAKFNIGSISYTIDDTNFGNVSDTTVTNTNIISKFKPLYVANFTGELEQNGFIEGANQQSNILITKNSLVSTTANNIYLKFYGSGSNIYNLKTTLPINQSVSKSTTLTTNYSFNVGNNNFKTLLNLMSGKKAVENIMSYLSTHISYQLNSKTIVYNTDVIGQDATGTDDITQQSVESSLKIIGLTHSKSGVEDIISGQTTQTIGSLDKSLLKTNIIKSSYNFAENVTGNTALNINNIDNPGAIKEVNKIIYFGKEIGNPANINYTLGNGPDITVTGNKTILVIGGNLYIKSNIQYSGAGMLGIIVLKDRNGNGGNVYIDPSVKKINSNIFAEKSLISYNGSEIDGDTDNASSILQNQLYIYGSVFSYNTIGGSAKNPLECPYYVLASNCSTKSQAQKYDLNYLRRYYLKKDSLGNLKPAYNGSNLFLDTDINYKYPLIIKYNPNIQSNPPPLFTN